MPRVPAARALPLLLALAAPAAAGCAAPAARVTFIEENDVFNLGDGLRTDRDRTQAARLAVTFPAESTPSWARAAAGAIPLFADGAPVHLGVVVGQEIATPEDLALTFPFPDDRPYVAWLFAGAVLQVPVFDPDAARRRDRRDTLEIDLGVVGPSAQGETAQNSFHRLFDIPDASGWDAQVEDEFAFLATAERRWRVLAGGGSGDGGRLGWDALPFLRARAGSVRVDGGAGGIVRVGWNLPRDFGPSSIDAHGLDRRAPPPGFWICGWAGGEGRGVAHDVLVSGGVFRDGPGVTEEPFVWSATAGLAAGWGPVTLAFGQTFTSPEFRERSRYHQVSTILLSAAAWF